MLTGKNVEMYTEAVRTTVVIPCQRRLSLVLLTIFLASFRMSIVEVIIVIPGVTGPEITRQWH